MSETSNPQDATGAEKYGIWEIGEDSEKYAALSEKEVREFYTWLVGKEQAEEDFAEHFRKLEEDELDAEIQYYKDHDTPVTITFRQILQDCMPPGQVSSGYV